MHPPPPHNSRTRSSTSRTSHSESSRPRNNSPADESETYDELSDAQTPTSDRRRAHQEGGNTTRQRSAAPEEYRNPETGEVTTHERLVIKHDCPDCTFLQWRDIDGSISGVIKRGEDITLSNEPLPSLGEVVDEYLVTHGYTTDTIQVLYAAINTCDHFRDLRSRVCGLGMSESVLIFISRWADKGLTSATMVRVRLPSKLDAIYSRMSARERAPAVTRRQKTTKKNPQRTQRKLTNAEVKLRRRRREQELEKYDNWVMSVQDQLWQYVHTARATLFPTRSAKRMHADVVSASLMKDQPERDTNAWSVYLGVHAKAHNDALPPGQSRLRITHPDIINPIKARWESMTTEERTEAVRDHIPEYEEKRTSDRAGKHTTAAAQAADMSRTIAKVVIELQNLHQRTDAEILLVCCRGGVDDSSKPFEFHTTDRVVTFVKEVTGSDPAKLARQMDGFCASGLAEVRKNYVKQMLDLKKVTALLITEKLAEISGNKLTKMSYQGFDDITDKFGIVVDNWPLSIFQAPSKYATKNEVQTLYDAWQSGTTRFRKLSTQEYASCCGIQSPTQQQPVRGRGGGDNGRVESSC
ncbi:hypothetical protein NM688_g9422 [Phlebia brevispora]|uniref:Uncharacterized protein n=1 Tax=Phlebia brevispora TaxID=194682 RepID=A0ACC1RJB1_9APHY|nr:hypothetical protein NM688_g9422 [Phlebia brevispora]